MSAPKRKRVVFLYLNGLHHIYHTAFSAYELSLLAPELDVWMLSSGAEHTTVLKQIGELYPGHRVRIKTLWRSLKYRFFNYRGRSYPSPWSTKYRAIANLRGAGGVVATSHIAPKLYAHWSATKPKYIYQFHGCGDRRYSFDPALAQFDYLLLPGEYYRERLTEEGIIGKNDWAVVGYPKFDFPGMTDRESGSIFFPGERPTVLYAPHWELEMSSLEAMGRKVLDYFFRSDRYNLIFAPHVLVKHWNYRRKLDLNFEAYHAPQIRIDLGSLDSVNGNYLRNADIYIGDVSSLVYEWVAIQPRPCIFLNPHQIAWKTDPDYRFWDFGPVIDDVSDLDQALEEAVQSDNYLAVQAERVAGQMDVTDVPASRRAAEAIRQFMAASE